MFKACPERSEGSFLTLVRSFEAQDARSAHLEQRTMRMTGIIFSDLGQAASFMALDWVQASLKQCLGFKPFPATLNVRPKSAEDTGVWRRAQRELIALPLPPLDGGFCSARIYRIEILPPASQASERIDGAVLLPEVKDYPNDKIEIVAPMRLKDHLGISDGDPLTLEFLN
jgi:CTP-dependent riboflavin kinase